MIKSSELKKLNNNAIRKSKFMIIIFILLTIIAIFAKGVYAYFINYTTGLTNNFTISTGKQITYNFYFVNPLLLL